MHLWCIESSKARLDGFWNIVWNTDQEFKMTRGLITNEIGMMNSIQLEQLHGELDMYKV